MPAPKHGKKYNAAAAQVDPEKLYTPAEALHLAKTTSFTKFDATVEVHMRMGVDPKHADQQVRDVVVLPHGLGKTVRVLVFAAGEGARLAQGGLCRGHVGVGRKRLLDQCGERGVIEAAPPVRQRARRVPGGRRRRRPARGDGHAGAAVGGCGGQRRAAGQRGTGGQHRQHHTRSGPRGRGRLSHRHAPSLRRNRCARACEASSHVKPGALRRRYWNATSAKLRSLRLWSWSTPCSRSFSIARMPMRRCWSTRSR